MPTDTTISRARRQFGLLQEYRTRLIADVVTGKLDVCKAAGLPEENERPERLDDIADGMAADRYRTEELVEEMARGKRGDRMTDWKTCPAVERRLGKLSGAWVFAGTRVPISALFENLGSGATVEQFLEWFPGVEEWKVKAILQHEAKALKAPVQP